MVLVDHSNTTQNFGQKDRSASDTVGGRQGTGHGLNDQASLADEDGELVKVSLVNLQVNQPLQPDPVAVARSKRREVHFEEEKVAERTRDVLWHLLPDPTPPAQKKKVFRSRRSNSAEDVVSVNSEDSTVSSAGRGTLDPWQRV
eukprot:g32444.t1